MMPRAKLKAQKQARAAELARPLPDGRRVADQGARGRFGPLVRHGRAAQARRVLEIHRPAQP